MSKLIQDLYEQRQGLVSDARERLDEINSNTDESRASELESQHDAAMDAVDVLDKKIEREERMERLNKAFDDREYQRRQEERDSRTPNLDGNGGDGGAPEDGRTYRQAFHALLQQGGQVHLLGDEDRSLIQGQSESMPAEMRQQVTTTGAAGGFTVPTELQNLLIKAMEAWGPMYGDIAQVLNTASGNPLDLPTVDDTGVTAGDAVKAEGTDLTDDGGKDVVFGQKSLGAYVYDTEFVRFSMELAQDSIFNVEVILADLLAERLAKAANRVLTVGTGTGQPNGIVTAAGAGLTAAAVAAIASDEIIDLEHSVDPAYRGSPSCRYMFNDNVLKLIRKLKDGDGNYLWQAGDFKNGVPGTLNGRAYSINQAMADPATGVKSMIFGDFKKYYVRKVGNIVLGIMRERFWPNLGIAGLIRLDGEMGDTRAIKALVQA